VSLADVPAVLILVGLVAYAVLGFADFGAGVWHLVGGDSEHGRRSRNHALHAMGPVWEANHVWLIFVLVVAWTAYPSAFGSIASTLVLPLFVAAVGIIGRGTAYALKSQSATRTEDRLIGGLFAFSSVLTPFALGMVAGGIASGRVPEGNAAGDLVTSWWNPTSVAVGALAVGTGIYLAAIYLAADAVRLREPDLAEEYRRRGLVSGVVVGVLAVAGLAVVRQDAEALWHGLTHGSGLAAIVVSAVCGLATLLLLRGGRYEPARVAGAGAVGAVLAGWAFAQRPFILPGLDVQQAAAGRPTLIAVIVAAAIGIVILAPSLLLLFGLLLRGRLDAEDGDDEAPREPASPGPAPARQRLLASAAVFLVIGVVFSVLEGDVVRVASIAGLLAFAAAAFLALADPSA
jgi:cytochrome d ubiquinol oxidase subunit II